VKLFDSSGEGTRGSTTGFGAWYSARFTMQLFESSLEIDFQLVHLEPIVPEDVRDLQKPNNRMAETFRAGRNDARVSVTEYLFYGLK
jgi:hypothetical protein